MKKSDFFDIKGIQLIAVRKQSFHQRTQLVVVHERSNSSMQSEQKTSVHLSHCFAIQEHGKVPETAAENENLGLEK